MFFLKAIVKYNEYIFAFASERRKSNNFRYRKSLQSDNFKKNNKKRKDLIPKVKQRRLKSDNFTGSIREQSYSIIAILKKKLLDITLIISHLESTNIIFVHYRLNQKCLENATKVTVLEIGFQNEGERYFWLIS